jgi:hypothetical protein
MTRTLGSYIAAVIVAYCFGALFISQGNIAAVTGLGFDVTMSQRLGAIVHDVSGMTDIYLPLVAVSLLLGLPVAFAVVRKNPHLRMIGYVSAGFVALLAMHVIMKAVPRPVGYRAYANTLGPAGPRRCRRHWRLSFLPPVWPIKGRLAAPQRVIHDESDY